MLAEGLLPCAEFLYVASESGQKFGAESQLPDLRDGSRLSPRAGVGVELGRREQFAKEHGQLPAERQDLHFSSFPHVPYGRGCLSPLEKVCSSSIFFHSACLRVLPGLLTSF